LRDAVAATTVLRAEISALRRKLTGSEKQAQQDAASRSALEGELAAAQNALAAAQRVGRALHALATTNSAPLDRLPPSDGGTPSDGGSALPVAREHFHSGASAPTGAGLMVFELPGEWRVRVERHVDAAALRRVLLALGVAD
jgi:hypothetical protein